MSTFPGQLILEEKMSDAVELLLKTVRDSLEKRRLAIEKQSLDRLLGHDAATIAERVAAADFNARFISAEGLCAQTIRALVKCDGWRHEDGVLYLPEDPSKNGAASKKRKSVKFTEDERKPEKNKPSIQILADSLDDENEEEDND